MLREGPQGTGAPIAEKEAFLSESGLFAVHHKPLAIA